MSANINKSNSLLKGIASKIQTYFILTLAMCLISIGGYAQSQIGIIPQISASFKFKNDWSISSKLEGRQLFFQNPSPGDEIQFERTDLETVLTKKVASSNSIGAGYLIRREGGTFMHRFIQQYTISTDLSGFELSHRFRLDESFEKDEAAKFRARYRIGFEKPLNGPELDPKEMYLKLSNEYIGSYKDRSGDLEVRGLAALGFNLSESNQLETGIDYRIEELTSRYKTHKLFLNIGWYHSF